MECKKCWLFFVSYNNYVITVSANFTFGNNIDVLTSPSKEELDFVDGLALSTDALGRLMTESPLYKLYNNKLSRDFVKGSKV